MSSWHVREHWEAVKTDSETGRIHGKAEQQICEETRRFCRWCNDNVTACLVGNEGDWIQRNLYWGLIPFSTKHQSDNVTVLLKKSWCQGSASEVEASWVTWSFANPGTESP